MKRRKPTATDAAPPIWAIDCPSCGVLWVRQDNEERTAVDVRAAALEEAEKALRSMVLDEGRIHVAIGIEIAADAIRALKEKKP